eukprot:183141_1
MSNVYSKRLKWLVSGYASESINGRSTPMALLKTIEKCHSAGQQPKLIVNRLSYPRCRPYGFSDAIELECYLIESNKLLNIYKYEITYKQKGENVYRSQTFKCMDSIDGISFVNINRNRNMWYDESYKVECIAMDKDDNILAKSSEISFSCVKHGFVSVERTDIVFNFNKIDINNKCCVNLKDWISSMKRLKIDGTELLHKKIFFYMLFQRNATDFTINKNDFENLLDTHQWFMCQDTYRKALNKLDLETSLT